MAGVIPRGVLRRWRQDDRGGATIIMAFLSVALLGLAAVGIDGAHFFLARRHQQAATDMAAMAAAASLATAGSTAAGVMAANGYAQAGLLVTTGAYAGDAALTPQARFVAGGAANAVQVVSTSTAPFIFGSAFRAVMGMSQPGDGFEIRTAAIARRQDQTAFTLGSGLASLDAGTLNAILGALLGTNLSLSVLDYQSLAAANVDLLDYGDALAGQVRVTTATYGALAVTAAPQSALLNSLASTLHGDARAGAAVRSIAGAAPVGGGGLIGTIVDFGSAGTLPVGTAHPLSGRVSALDVLRAVALLNGSGHLASVDFGATVPGLGSTQLLLSVGEPAVGSSYFAIGPEGATLHTAQVRLLLLTQVGGSGLPASLALPLYLEVAPATASVSTIACANGADAGSVTLGVVTGAANAAIGSVSRTDFANMAAPPTLAPATLLNIAGVLSVSARARATATPPGSVPASFSASDIKAGTVKTVSSGVSLAALASNLVGATEVTVALLGLGAPQPSLPSAVTGALQAALTPIDALLAKALLALGASVGTATTSVPGLRCSQGSLVN